MSRTRLAAVAAALVLSLPAVAAPIAMTAVRSAANTHSGMTVDATTGTVYEAQGYYGLTTLVRYANLAAFDAGTSNGTQAVPQGVYGPYLAAQGGTVYARTGSSSGTQLSAVGALNTTISVSDMGGANGTDTFDWGGFSGVAAMNDGQHLYVVGGDASTGNWRINTYDFALTLLNSVSFGFGAATGCAGGPGSPGFGFAIDGKVLLGSDFCSGQISTMVDAATGAVSAVDFTLAGFTGSYKYITNTSYDSASDTLYAMDLGSNKYYKLGGAAAAFGIDTSNDVPEPSGLALAGLALALAGIQRRRARG